MDYYGFVIFLIFNLILIIGFIFEYSSGAISLNKLKPLKNNNLDKDNILFLNKNIYKRAGRSQTRLLTSAEDSKDSRARCPRNSDVGVSVSV